MNSAFLIVGAGLTGSTIARELADKGEQVIVVDRRPHIGGNVHDHWHPSGIRIHTYGPHYFRTSSEVIWSFVNRFSQFYKYEACLKSDVDGSFENWPIAASYIRRAVGNRWHSSFTGTPSNFEEASLAMMPAVIYEKFVKGYTEKQWGVPCRELSAALSRRFDVREDDEPRLMRHRYQGIPQDGYAVLMRNLLEGIPVILNFDYLQRRDEIKPRKMLIFTGPIDEFFNFRYGRLKYRGQSRIHEYMPDVEFAQPCGQVNNPNPLNGPHIRTLEWKHMMPPDYASRIRGTVLTREMTETPVEPDQYEYPFPDEANAALYLKYRSLADSTPDVLICGRLGEYTYYDMDQAIGRAFLLARRILGSKDRSLAAVSA